LRQPAPSRVVSFTEASLIVREHADRILKTAAPSSQIVSLPKALGRTLAEPIRADRDQPPFPRATRDGFACHAADLRDGGWLKVVGQVRAGEVWKRPPIAAADRSAGSENPRVQREPETDIWPEDESGIHPGEAVEIMTGAPAPSGADCVVMIEHVEQADGRVRLSGGRNETASNIIPVGAEARAGEVIVPMGARMEAPQIAAAAACGAAQVRVFCAPRAAILPTGDELVEVADVPLPFQIRNSNGYSLAAQVAALCAEPVRLNVARDQLSEIEAGVRAGLDADLLLITGGVSMGKYDLVEEVMLGLGAEFYFTGALIQPGKPVVFGSVEHNGRRKYFFGLPGNPVSTMVTFALFAAPMLNALGGRPSGPRFVQAKLVGRCEGRPGITRFLPAALHNGAEWPKIELMIQAVIVPHVEPIVFQGSGDIAAVSRANCFLVVPSGRTSLEPGETVTVLL